MNFQCNWIFSDSSFKIFGELDKVYYWILKFHFMLTNLLNTVYIFEACVSIKFFKVALGETGAASDWWGSLVAGVWYILLQASSRDNGSRGGKDTWWFRIDDIHFLTLNFYHK